jgi:iron complex outermembrane recepter protein
MSMRWALRGMPVVLLASAVAAPSVQADTGEVADTRTAGAVTQEAGDAIPSRQPSRRAGEGLEQITVSARKREEKLQETPLSVSAFSATALRNADVLRADDLTRLTPNLKYEVSPTLTNAAAVMIRGIGNADAIATRDNGVGVYVDGIYLARTQGQLFDLGDIQRVEVLRGPQGTLFGRNTIGGAINVITRKPGSDFAVEGSARAGNLNLFQSRGSVNIPIVPEVLAAMFSFSSITRDGYTENQLNGQETDDRKSLGFRAALRFNPTERFEALLTGEQTRSHTAGRGGECRYNAQAFANSPAVQIQQLSGFNFVQNCLANQGDGDELEYSSPVRSKDNLDAYSLTSQLTYELSDLATLKSLSSYQKLVGEGVVDLTFANTTGNGGPGAITPFGILDVSPDENDQISQEFNLTGELLDGRLNYTAGLFAFYEKTTPGLYAQLPSFNLCTADPNTLVFPAAFEQAIKPLFAGLGQDPNQPLAPQFKQIAVCSGSFTARGPRTRTNAYAGYGQVTYDLTESLHLTGGLRYSSEMKQFSYTQQTFLTPTIQFDAFSGMEISQTERFGKWTPLANLSYDLSEGSIVYASYTRGFKSGGFNGRPNANVAISLQPFDQEVLDTYEIGYKSTSFDNRLQTSVAVFYGIYDDIQRTIQSSGGGGQFASRVANAGEGVIRGAEFEVRAAPLLGLELRVGLGFTDAEYREYDDILAGPFVNGVQTFMNISRRNEEFYNTPNFTGSFSAAYTLFDLAGFGDLTTRLNWYHQNAADYAPGSTINSIRQGTYGLLSGQLFMALADGKTEIGVFGDNLLNRRYINGAISFEDGFALSTASFGPPRTYGVEIRRRF